MDSEEAYLYLKERGAFPLGACIFKTAKGYHAIMRSSTITPYSVPQGSKELVARNPIFKDIGIGGENQLSIMPDTPGRGWIKFYGN